MTYLFDTDVVIDFFKKRDHATQLVTTLAQKHDLCTSVIVVAEIRVGWTEQEAGNYLPVLHRLFPSVGITDAIAELGGKLRRDYQQRGQSVFLPDALIAATAIAEDYCLVTRNTKDFPMPELTLYRDVTS
jgi:predicted nucleic acid-binding protein